MRYSDIDFNVVYVDPSRSTNGDGSTPAAAANKLPDSVAGFADNTCYLIRRTAENSAVVIPNGSSSTIKNLLIMGMPNASDEMYELVPAAAKTAWGGDSAEYANVQSTAASGSFALPQAQRFLLHRVYLFRDGINADNYILKFQNSSNLIGCFAFEHCKFGSRGINVDKSTYTGALTTSRLKSYVYIYYARMLNISDCIINHALTGNSSNPCGFYCYFADVLNVQNVKIFSPVWSDYTSNAYPLYLAGTYQKGIECIVRNVEQTIRMNGTATHVPTLLYLQGYISCTVENITVKMGTALATGNPSSLSIDYAMMYFYYVYEISMKTVSVNLPGVWYAKEPVIEMNRCYSGNYVPGVVKKIEDVNIVLASTAGIGAACTYANAATYNDNYAAVVFNFSQSDCTMYAKVPEVTDITVKCPRGKAAYFENVRLTDAEFEGTVVLSYTEADITSVKTWFPGKALYVQNGSHARVRLMEANLSYPEYPYNEDPLVFSTLDNNGSVFVDSANASLSPMTASSSKAQHIYQGIGCNNEGASGHFTFRCQNGLCDTWSVRRTGGGTAALKLTNNTCSGADTMVLGRRPFNGMQLTPTTTGRHLLKAHIAFKGYAVETELYRQFFLSATIGGKTYYSSIHGRWADDSASTWVNDSNLTQRVLEMPVDIPTSSPVDVRVYFAWYSSGGFVYLDPAIELVTV